MWRGGARSAPIHCCGVGGGVELAMSTNAEQAKSVLVIFGQMISFASLAVFRSRLHGAMRGVDCAGQKSIVKIAINIGEKQASKGQKNFGASVSTVGARVGIQPRITLMDLICAIDV